MKMITDYEVYGNWSTHENPSKYWQLKRNDGLYLYCCPNGCPLDFQYEMKCNVKDVDKSALDLFCLAHNIKMSKNDINLFLIHNNQVQYFFVKDFVYNYNGFKKFHYEYCSNKPNTEFLIDLKSGLVFFNIYSHEPFASDLYKLLYPTISREDILSEATYNGLCVWKSTVSDSIFGLENADNYIVNKFR